jgi:drug/metabolite transporter (DMT)-like permease
VTAVLGGLGAALLWGLSTVAASRSTRRIGTRAVLAYVMVVGLAPTPAACSAPAGRSW